MAQQAKERHSIESQIHMAMSHGSIETNQHGQIVVPSEDAFNIFQRLPGSPAYWKSFRNDLCAKMEQYGPFHVFFTKSCAEARWACVLIEVLKVELNRRLEIMYLDNYVSKKDQKVNSFDGKDIDPEYEKRSDQDNILWNGETATVLVYDKTITGGISKDKKAQNSRWKSDREIRLRDEIKKNVKK